MSESETVVKKPRKNRRVFRVDICKKRQDINKDLDSGYSRYSLIITKKRRTGMRSNVKLLWTN